MDANSEKGISIVIFFLITMVAGTIPILLYSGCRRQIQSHRGQTVLSLLNCFAGGVFLATCLLNLLQEGLEEYEEFKELVGFDSEYPFFHLGIAAGLFFVALVERVAMCLSVHHPAIKEEVHGKEEEEEGKRSEWGKRGDHFKHSRKIVKPAAGVSNGVRASEVELTAVKSGTALSPSTEVGLSSSSTTVCTTISAVDRNDAVTRSQGSSVDERKIGGAGTDKTDSSGRVERDEGEKEVGEEEEAEEEEAEDRFSGQTSLRAIVLLLALSFHTIFDGLAVGLQETETDIWTTTAAVSVHKTIVAVSLGLELATAMGHRPVRAFLLLFVFALMAPIGLGIGMGVTSGRVDERAHLLAGSVLQAVATGSFLYVTFFEVLAEELGRDSSVLKIVVTVVGFGAMAVAKIWDTD